MTGRAQRRDDFGPTPPTAGAHAAERLAARSARGGRAIVVCEQWLGSNAYAGMKALRRAGWLVHAMSEWEYVPARWRSAMLRGVGRALRVAAVREFNAELVRQAERLRPEFLLVFKGTFVRREALRTIRSLGVRTYCFFPDVSFRAHGRYIPDALPEYDWVFTAKTFGLRDLREQLGVERAGLLRHGYDPDLHRPVELSRLDVERYGCDVSFIGTWSPKKERVLATLAEARPSLHLRVWGEQWHRARGRALERTIGGHEVIGEEYVRAIRASAVNLALLSERRDGASDGDRITSRTFHIPACGGFMLHERTEEVAALFREDWSVACFADVAELLAKIDAYLANAPARAAIAARGLEAVTAAHSWDHRVRAILDHHASAP